jgi:uncharacterized membrane protein
MSMFRERSLRSLRTCLLLWACILPACSTPTANCPTDLPAACPADIPSFKTTVAPIVASHCTLCHSVDGSQSGHSFATYDLVYASRSAVLDQIYACNMPPAGAAQLALAERVTVLTWLVCGSPNN